MFVKRRSHIIRKMCFSLVYLHSCKLAWGVTLFFINNYLQQKKQSHRIIQIRYSLFQDHTNAIFFQKMEALCFTKKWILHVSPKNGGSMIYQRNAGSMYCQKDGIIWSMEHISLEVQNILCLLNAPTKWQNPAVWYTTLDHKIRRIRNEKTFPWLNDSIHFIAVIVTNILNICLLAAPGRLEVPRKAVSYSSAQEVSDSAQKS